jgi:copper chaperone
MSLELSVPSIVCSGCADAITKAIKNLDSEASVDVNLETKMVTVDSKAEETALKEAITEIGHTVG